MRFAWLPSDFNPMLLILGDGPQLDVLADGLERWALSPAEVTLEALVTGCASPSGTRVALEGVDGRPAGLRRVAGGFAWRLDAATARGHAALLRALAASTRHSGSAMLGPEAPDEARGLPVKVSRGEYLDEVLERGSAA